MNVGSHRWFICHQRQDVGVFMPLVQERSHCVHLSAATSVVIIRVQPATLIGTGWD